MYPTKEHTGRRPGGATIVNTTNNLPEESKAAEAMEVDMVDEVGRGKENSRRSVEKTHTDWMQSVWKRDL